jgi:hypothetical protein
MDTKQMTAAERIDAALNGRPFDRLPWCPFLAYVWENFPPQIQALGQSEFLRQVGADPLWRGAPGPVQALPVAGVDVRTVQEGDLSVVIVSTPVGSIRSGSRSSPAGRTTFLVEHPLKTEEDFKVQTWIEEHTRLCYDETALRAHLTGAGGEGLSLGMLVPRGKSAWQSLVEYHVGTVELVYALADYPQTVGALWEAMVARNLEAVRLAAQCDALTYWITWEDSGTQNYSPAQYDRFIGAEIGRWCQVLAANDKRYLQHACGNVRDLVGRMQAHGAYGVESISPPPTGNLTLAEARRIVGGDFAIIGGIEPTHFLNLSLDALDAYVEQVIADGAGGPFVLANSDSCPPGVTMEKFQRVGQIVRRR